jgi:uncharacterized protein (TIGR03083 family)
MVDKPALRHYFEDTQREFVTLAGSLTPEQWATPSLCEGWTVRDVVVHTAWHIHLKPSLATTRDLVQFLVLGNARFTRMHMARDAARSNESLVRWLESPAPCSENYLCELMMHQQDVRRPLGMSPGIPADRLAWMLSYCMTKAGNRNAGGKPRDRVQGLRLVASDIEWSAGDGPEVCGPGEALLIAITGRRGAAEELSGSGVAVLEQRTNQPKRLLEKHRWAG